MYFQIASTGEIKMFKKIAILCVATIALSGCETLGEMATVIAQNPEIISQATKTPTTQSTYGNSGTTSSYGTNTAYTPTNSGSSTYSSNSSNGNSGSSSSGSQLKLTKTCGWSRAKMVNGKCVCPQEGYYYANGSCLSPHTDG